MREINATKNINLENGLSNIPEVRYYIDNDVFSPDRAVVINSADPVILTVNSVESSEPHTRDTHNGSTIRMKIDRRDYKHPHFLNLSKSLSTEEKCTHFLNRINLQSILSV